MYQTITEHEFIQSFDSIRPDNFTRRARQELFTWYTELEDGTGEQIEIDVIAICCDWTEYTADEIWREYSDNFGLSACTDESFADLLEMMQDETTLIHVEQYGEDTYLVFAF